MNLNHLLSFINMTACIGGAVAFWHLGHNDHKRGLHWYGSLGTFLSAVYASVAIINLINLIHD